jgi:sulfotransferase
MEDFKKMFFLSGLPRTGSTLLTSILSQNPKILSEGSSALGRIISINEYILHQDTGIQPSLLYTNKLEKREEIIKSIIKTYYEDSNANFVIDKDRNWTASNNIELIKKYIDKNPKIIIMVRSVEEIAESFYYIYQKQGKAEYVEKQIFKDDNPFVFPFKHLKEAIKENKEYLLIISYKELVLETKKTIEKIYNFLNIPPFEHNYSKIKNIFPEGDYGTPGLHEVREEIGFRRKNIILPQQLKSKAKELQKDLARSLEEAGFKDVYF